MSEPDAPLHPNCTHIVPGYAANPDYDVFAVHCAACGATVRKGLPYMLLGIPYHHTETLMPWMGLERKEEPSLPQTEPTPKPQA